MRADTTFSDRDIIRIFTRHLTKNEKENVRCFFLIQEKYKESKRGPIESLLKLGTEIARRVAGGNPIVQILIDLLVESAIEFAKLEEKRKCLKRIEDLEPLERENP